jgi:signal transduction histidine kinase
VIVAVERGEGLLRVIDRGPGLHPDEMAQVFEPFYRSPTAQERAGGAGLGLAVSKRVIELMGGRIWVRASEAGGTEFGFALPLLDESEA